MKKIAKNKKSPTKTKQELKKKISTGKKKSISKEKIFFKLPTNVNLEKSVPPAKPITFGLLQHEIDEILNKQNFFNKTDRQIEYSLEKALAEYLPKEEEIILPEAQKKQLPSKKRELIIKNVGHRVEHSPFVLDLSHLVSQKRKQLETKENVLKFLAQKEGQIKVPTKKFFKKSTQQQEKSIIIQKKVTTKIKTKLTEKLNSQFTSQPWHYHLNIPYFWPKKALTYLLLGLIIISPYKVFGHYEHLLGLEQKIKQDAQETISELKSAKENILQNNLEVAGQDFSEAKQKFLSIENQLTNLNIALRTILKIVPLPGLNLSDAEKVIRIGENITLLGEKIPTWHKIFSSSDTLTEKISFAQKTITENIPTIQQINTDLSEINPNSIPIELKDEFIETKNIFQKAYFDITNLADFLITLNDVLGKDDFKRYLFVFQNSNEIRATGGFMGSFALVDIDRGKIKNLEIPEGGTYDVQGQLTKTVISPHPLHLINPRWELQDSNWYPDFSVSAKKIKWFYEQAGGPTIDGVVAINSSFLPEIMKLTGPIHLPSFGKTINSENVITELQKTISAENILSEKNNKPKKILSELAPLIIEKFFDSSQINYPEIIKIINSSLSQKSIQLYFKNKKIQEVFSQRGWTGEIKQTNHDYLLVVNTNIGGGKSDQFINQNIDLKSTINQDGSIINKLTIKREHFGDKMDEFGKDPNLNYVRVYVPKGSKLLKVSGQKDVPVTLFEKPDPLWDKDAYLSEISGEISVEPISKTFINNELGKTVFANWMQTDSGKSTEMIIEYQLPFKLRFNKKQLLRRNYDSLNHAIFVQKQSGQQNTTISVELSVPEEKTILPIRGERRSENKITSLQNTNSTDFWLAGTIKNR